MKVMSTGTDILRYNSAIYLIGYISFDSIPERLWKSEV